MDFVIPSHRAGVPQTSRRERRQKEKISPRGSRFRMEMICVSVERLQTTPWSIFIYYNRNYENELSNIFAFVRIDLCAHSQLIQTLSCRHVNYENTNACITIVPCHVMPPPLPPTSPSCHAMSCHARENRRIVQTHKINEFSLLFTANAVFASARARLAPLLKWNTAPETRRNASHNNENFKYRTCSKQKTEALHRDSKRLRAKSYPHIAT